MRRRPLYASKMYAMAFGLPILDVPEWRTAVLKRLIPESAWSDALGCYPLCSFDRAADLAGGLQRLRDADLVSISLVANPVDGPDPRALRENFTVCRPFKTHYLIDHSARLKPPSATHRRWMGKALRECEVSKIRLLDSLGEWERLYRTAIARHHITGLQAFSSEYFAVLAGMPDVEAFAARVGKETVAMALWVRDPEVVYYHLGASSAHGYETHAMYGIFAAALEYYAGVRLIHLGGAAGVTASEHDGLARFKRGFANRQLDAYFCGACLDQKRYASLSHDPGNTDFFPAYRRP
jgi:Acetyltransferase (GNAT) domain